MGFVIMPSEASWLALARANPPTIRTPLTDRTHRSCRRAAAGGCSGAPRVSRFSVCLSYVSLSVALTAGRSATCGHLPGKQLAATYAPARALFACSRMQPDGCMRRGCMRGWRASSGARSVSLHRPQRDTSRHLRHLRHLRARRRHAAVAHQQVGSRPASAGG